MWIVDGEEELKIILLHCFPLLTCTTIIELKIYFISLWFNGWLGKIPSLLIYTALCSIKHLLKIARKSFKWSELDLEIGPLRTEREHPF